VQRPRVTDVVLALLCLMYFVTYLDRVNVSSAAAGFSKDFGLNKTQIGLVFSAFAYPYLVFQIIGGWVSDRFGARRTLIVCGLVWGGATVLTGAAGGLASMLAARFLLGLGEGATFPAATTAMSRWVPKAKRGYAQGITHAGARIGNAVAPAAIVFIMTTYGWRQAFYGCAAMSFSWLAIWALTFTEFPKDHPRVTALELASLPPPATVAANVPWRRLFKRMAPVTMVYFCYGWTLWLFLSWIPQYFLHSQNLDLKKSALFASCVWRLTCRPFHDAGIHEPRFRYSPGSHDDIVLPPPSSDQSPVLGFRLIIPLVIVPRNVRGPPPPPQVNIGIGRAQLPISLQPAPLIASRRMIGSPPCRTAPPTARGRPPQPQMRRHRWPLVRRHRLRWRLWRWQNPA
jgi:MFS family permease